METDDTTIERVARAIHQLYLARQRERGRSTGDTATMAPWLRLPEDAREANRAQARDIAAKLRAIDCMIRPGRDPGFTFSDDELDRLAREEHQRWCDQRRHAGWRFGDVRDDAARHHPDLVPWDRLSEEERRKDRDVVQNIPTVLSAVSLRVVRTAPRR